MKDNLHIFALVLNAVIFSIWERDNMYFYSFNS